MVSHWLLSTTAWVRLCGICGSATGAGFMLILQIPLPVIPLIAPGADSRPSVTCVPSGLIIIYKVIFIRILCVLLYMSLLYKYVHRSQQFYTFNK
jgi:hypothetical protein